MANNITKVLKDLDREVGRNLIYGHPFNKKILNTTQIHIVGYLLKNHDRDVCQKELEEEIHLKKASITGSIDSLEEKGLVERVISKEDKRKKFIKLTHIVLDKKSVFEKRVQEIDKKIIAGFTEEELAQFENMVERMKKNLEN